MEINVDDALAAQGLDASDLEINREGRVSDKQIARQISVRRSGAVGAWITAVCIIAGSGSFGAWKFLHNGDTGIIIFMSLLGLFLAAFPLGIYYAFRFPDPAKIAACAVARIENAEVSAFLPASNRGVYTISLNNQRFSGFANDLTRAYLGSRVNAYVVSEHRIVVAIEPVG